MRAHRLGVLAAVGVVAVAVEWLGGGHDGLAVADAAVGIAFLAGGAAVAQAERRLAVLFLATGAAWFLGTLAGSDVALLANLGAALLYVHRGPLVHLLLGYPSGALRSRLDRLVVAAAYLDGVVVTVAQDEPATVALVMAVVATAALGLRRAAPERRAARALATACAAVVGAALALASVAGLAGTTALSETTLLLAYEAALLVTAAALAAGVLAARTEPAAVADLVVELGASPRSGAVREALARAFGDPSLEVVYRLGNGYVGPDGASVPVPSNGNGRAVTLVERDGEPVAALVHDAAVASDASLLEAVVAATRLSAANARLQAELQARLDELAASRRRAVEVGDAQRSRLERRLNHAVELYLHEVREALARASEAAPASATSALAVVERELDAAQADLHELARGIHPRALTERGLAAAVAELASTAPVPVDVRAPSERFPPTVETAAYFVCAEALANVAKYARATRVSVGLLRERDGLVVGVADDGVGGADPCRGSGLRGLADRIEAVGGRLSVTTPPGGGTTVSARIPLEPD
jgi:signal transduction histidine kinase